MRVTFPCSCWVRVEPVGALTDERAEGSRPFSVPAVLTGRAEFVGGRSSPSRRIDKVEVEFTRHDGESFGVFVPASAVEGAPSLAEARLGEDVFDALVAVDEAARAVEPRGV